MSTTLSSTSDFAAAWTLSRSRLNETISDLNHEQLSWRIYPGSLSIAEMAIHVAGVELYFISQLTGGTLDEGAQRLTSAATDGVVNDKPFPFERDYMTPAFVRNTLEVTGQMVGPHISHPTDEILAKEIVSALGPVISGEGAFTRLAFHAAYHQGQAYLIRSDPRFPG